MVPLEVWLLGGAVLAFGGALWLVAQRERRGIQVFEAMADAAGWDCRQCAPDGLAARLCEIVHVAPVDATRLFLAGPATPGPFQMLRVATTGRPRGGEIREWTFLHLRTPAASRGLWLEPSARFRAKDGASVRAAGAFARRFQVGCVDAEDYERAEDDELRSLLLRPEVPVRIGWVDQDLVIAFPLGVASPRGVQNLLDYGTAVAARLLRPLVAAHAAVAPEAGSARPDMVV